MQAPDTMINGFNICHEVLHFMDLPILNPSDPDHYLTPTETRKYIDSESPSHTTLQSYIPNPKLNTDEAKAIAIAKNWDWNHDFRAMKVRLTVNCDSCRGPRCIYSTNSIGCNNGPSQVQLTNLERSIENGYVCGHKIDTEGFYARHHLRCGDYVESQYYRPDTGTKGGRIVTAECCSICFCDDDIYL